MFPTSISLSSSAHLGPMVLLSIGSGVLLCCGILKRRDVLLLLLAWMAGLLAFAADDLIHLLMLSSAATWLATGVISCRAESGGEESDQPILSRWLIGLFLADVLSISALSVLGTISFATDLPKLIPMLPQLEELEPALLGMVGLLLLLSLSLRLLLYPGWGWMDVSFAKRKSQLLLVGFLLPLQLLAWQRLLPLIHITEEVRALGVGVCMLSAVLFGVQSLSHPNVKSRLTFLGLGWSSLCLLSSLVSPPPVLWGVTPCYVTGLIGLTLLRRREKSPEPQMTGVTIPTFALVTGFILWGNLQLFLAAQRGNSVEGMTSSGPISLITWGVAQALMWGSLFQHAGLGDKPRDSNPEHGHSMLATWSIAVAVLAASAVTLFIGTFHTGTACGLALAVVMLQRWLPEKNEEASTSELPPMRVRLSESNFYLKPLVDNLIAWPFACFAFVVHFLAEWLFVKLPTYVATTFEGLTVELLSEMDSDEGKSLGWEVLVGSMVVLAVALYAAG
ncbi:MAG: hypothetical protein KDA88_00665 [Planctomycetaceae bacterium]|nr:hypothetical protein [Planctomycetaceae bacterium]